jgi:predicted  nucleic acid-binding Zn-ribbon protein
MDEVKAYCMKCKTERVVQEAHVVTTKNGRRAAQGTCPVCGTKMFKFLPKADKTDTTETVPAEAPVQTPPAPPTEPAPMG